jgi:hypothetical protein
MTLDNLKPSILQLSSGELYALHQEIRRNRFISKRKIREKKVVVKRTTSKVTQLIVGMSDEELKTLLEEL